jgi:hypothetical protein
LHAAERQPTHDFIILPPQQQPLATQVRPGPTFAELATVAEVFAGSTSGTSENCPIAVPATQFQDALARVLSRAAHDESTIAADFAFWPSLATALAGAARAPQPKTDAAATVAFDPKAVAAHATAALSVALPIAPVPATPATPATIAHVDVVFLLPILVAAGLGRPVSEAEAASTVASARAFGDEPVTRVQFLSQLLGPLSAPDSVGCSPEPLPVAAARLAANQHAKQLLFSSFAKPLSQFASNSRAASASLLLTLLCSRLSAEQKTDCFNREHQAITEALRVAEIVLRPTLNEFVDAQSVVLSTAIAAAESRLEAETAAAEAAATRAAEADTAPKSARGGRTSRAGQSASKASGAKGAASAASGSKGSVSSSKTTAAAAAAAAAAASSSAASASGPSLVPVGALGALAGAESEALADSTLRAALSAAVPPASQTLLAELRSAVCGTETGAVAALSQHESAVLKALLAAGDQRRLAAVARAVADTLLPIIAGAVGVTLSLTNLPECPVALVEKLLCPPPLPAVIASAGAATREAALATIAASRQAVPEPLGLETAPIAANQSESPPPVSSRPTSRSGRRTPSRSGSRASRRGDRPTSKK